MPNNTATRNIAATNTDASWDAERQAILNEMRHHHLDFAALGNRLGVAGSSIRAVVYKRQQPARPRLLAMLRSWLHEVREVAAPADVPFRGPSAGNGAGTAAHTGHAAAA
jgi:hypothetical protein